MVGQVWEVVGGADKGGIVVRQGKDTSSPLEPARLSTGALVEEIELDGERLNYRRLTGTGPDAGWASIRLKDGKPLLSRKDQAQEQEQEREQEQEQEAKPEPAEEELEVHGTWEVLYNKGVGRAQQLRLLFIYSGTEFQDRRLEDMELEMHKSWVAGDASPLAFDAVPAVRHGARCLSTVAGAMQYVGESLGLGFDDELSRAKASQLVTGSEAMRTEVFYAAFAKIAEKGKRITSVGNEAFNYNKWLGHFERFLRTHAAAAEAEGREAGPFALGPQPCYADLALYDCLTAIWDTGCYGRDEAERAVKYPRLCALVDTVGRLPALVGYGHPHAEELDATFGPLPPPPSPPGGKSIGQVWEVVGGGDKGGVLVRSGKDVSSATETARLATGALVKEIEMDGDRIRYQRLAGSGPDTGWVSIRLKEGKVLLARTVKRPPVPTTGPAIPPAPTDGTWRILYYSSCGRGQQIRLLFRCSGTAFEDRRLGNLEAEDYKSRSAGDASPLAFDFVPVVQHEGQTVATTAGALQYAGERLGLGASGGEAARATALMLAVGGELMRNEIFFHTYHAMMKVQNRVLVGADFDAYNRWFGHFERHLGNAAAASAAEGLEEGPFLLGSSKFCYADLALYDAFTGIWDVGPYSHCEAECAWRFPRVRALVDAVAALPGLSSYGRPHAEEFAAKFGPLPSPRGPEDEPPAPPPRQGRRAVLEGRLAEAEVALREAGAAADSQESYGQGAEIRVATGTSQLIADHPGLVEQLTALINLAYDESVRDLPARKDNHKSVNLEEVYGRLCIGDGGMRSNRVLHVAFQGDRPVGCVSSSFRTPWTEEGVGHWGLLAVDPSVQGGGVASKLVGAAMRRLATGVQEVHIEFHHTRKHEYSERLKSWYEGKLGFNVVGAQPSAKDTTLRICRRKLTQEEQSEGKRRRLSEVRDALAAELASLGPEVAGREGEDFQCHRVFQAFASLVRSKGAGLAEGVAAAFQFEVHDAGPEGLFFVDLRPGFCCAWYGEERTADCRIVLADADLEPWLVGELEHMHGFWSGRVHVAKDTGDHVHKLHYIYAEVLKE